MPAVLRAVPDDRKYDVPSVSVLAVIAMPSSDAVEPSEEYA